MKKLVLAVAVLGFVSCEKSDDIKPSSNTERKSPALKKGINEPKLRDLTWIKQEGDNNIYWGTYNGDTLIGKSFERLDTIN